MMRHYQYSRLTHAIARAETCITAALAVITVAMSTTAYAQTAAEEIAAGNKAVEARRAPEALQHYERALTLDPKSAEALWRAAHIAVDLGEFDPNEAHRTALYKTAEQRARLSTQILPNDAESHYTLAKALGRTALTLGKRERIKYAKEVRAEALTCLKLNSKHPGCLHIMGLWNAEVMRLNSLTRMLAKNFLGGQIFDQASWSEAIRYMTLAVANDPRRAIHRLDLALIYADRDRKADARNQLQATLNAPLIDYNDPKYKEIAAKTLKSL